jgi:apolipoprotein N-acyltransferase
VKSQTNENISALLAGDLAMTDAKTFADRLGGVAPLLVLLATLIFALLGIRRSVAL